MNYREYPGVRDMSSEERVARIKELLRQEQYAAQYEVDERGNPAPNMARAEALERMADALDTLPTSQKPPSMPRVIREGEPIPDEVQP